MSSGTPDADLGVLLTIAVGVFKDRLHAHLATAGYDDLGPSFGFVFRSLADRELSLAELATMLGITPQGALKIVNEMVAKDYVERRDDSNDGRVRRLVLTTRGRAALREARRFHARAERELVAQLGANRVAGARAVLESLAAGADPEAPWASGTRPF